MKNFFYYLVTIFAICNLHVQAQDLIVTSRGDSLQVRLHDGGGEFIRFDLKERQTTTVRELPQSEIKSLIKGYFSDRTTAGVAKDTNLSIPDTTILEVSQPLEDSKPLEVAFLDTLQVITAYRTEWALGGYLGLSKRLFSPKIGLSQSDLDYLQKIKTGYSFGLSGDYFFRKRWGFGIRYDTYWSSAQKNEMTANRVLIQFIGTSLIYRTPVRGLKGYVQTGFELGYQPYRNNATFDGVKAFHKANSMGWGLSIGYHRRVTEKLALSLTSSLLVGTSYKMVSTIHSKSQVIQLNRHNFEDLTRASITLGLSFAGSRQRNR